MRRLLLVGQAGSLPVDVNRPTYDEAKAMIGRFMPVGRLSACPTSLGHAHQKCQTNPLTILRTFQPPPTTLQSPNSVY